MLPILKAVSEKKEEGKTSELLQRVEGTVEDEEFVI